MLVECPSCKAHFVVAKSGEQPCPVCNEVFVIEEEGTVQEERAPSLSVGEWHGEIEQNHAEMFGEASTDGNVERPELAGESCALHPENAATGICSRCGKFVCDECLGMIEEQPYCPNCYYDVIDSLGEFLPWEDFTGTSFLDRYIATARMLIFSPSEAAERMDKKDAVKPAFTFTFITSIIAFLVYFLLSFLLLGIIHNPMSSLDRFMLVMSFIFFILVPFLMLMNIVIVGIILHIITKMFGVPRQRSISSAIRVIAYSQAGLTWNFIPVLGALLSLLSFFITQFFLIRKTYGTSNALTTLLLIISSLVSSSLFSLLK